MRTFAVVLLNVLANGTPSVVDRLVGSQINLFVLDAAPHALDEHVVAPGAFAVHRQPNASAQHRLGEGSRRELAALIGVHDAGVPIAGERFFQRFNGMHGLQRDRHAVREDRAAGSSPPPPSDTRIRAPSGYSSYPVPRPGLPD